MNTEYSVIILKELVILPNQEIKIEIKSELSQKIINNSYELENKEVLVVPPINKWEENPNTDDLPKVGVIAQIKSKIDLPNGNIRVTLKGIKRVIINEYYNKKKDKEILYGSCIDLDLPKYNPKEETAVIRKLKKVIKDYIESSSNITNSVVSTINKTTDLNFLTDIITTFLPFNTLKKLEYMQNVNAIKRAYSLLVDIEEEIEINKIENEINERLNERFEKNNKDFILKEKIKEIEKELGNVSFKDNEVKRYLEILNKLKLNEKTYNKIKEEIDKYSLISEESPENSVIHNYLETLLNLPWNKQSKETTNIEKITKELNNTHYGMEEIKTRIIEYIKIKEISNKDNSPIICLVGPPGVGKTTIARSIASSLNREFVKISVGGLNDSLELIGSRKTYLGASPGKIIQGIKKCGYNNPIILIDEVDKMVKDYKGDPAATLLEILDPVQNKYFIDNYIEEPFDLSKVMFILTANDEYDIPYTLLDRLEIIKVNSYTIFEKENIANKYLLPKIYEEYNFKTKIKFSSDLINTIINKYTDECGVRELDRVLHKLIRKIIVNEPNNKIINKDNIKKLLGEYKYDNIKYSKILLPGCSYILGKTSLGGIVNKIEIIKTKGNGNVKITGNVGNVMDESVSVALSYIESKYKLKTDNVNIHIHFLSGGTKKDGPSAGVSITSALISSLLNIPIKDEIAFTGEISLNGDILPIGGLKDKIIAAYNYGIKVIYIPDSNSSELIELPEKIQKNIEIKTVKSYNEIYQDLFKS